MIRQVLSFSAVIFALIEFLQETIINQINLYYYE